MTSLARLRLFAMPAAMLVAAVTVTHAQSPPATESPSIAPPVAESEATDVQAPVANDAAGTAAEQPQATAVPEPQVRIYSLEHLTANEAVFVVSRLLGEQVRASATPNNGGMIAVGAPDDLQQVERLLRVLDQPPPAEWPGKEELTTNLEANVSVDQQVAQNIVWLHQRNPWIPRPKGEIKVFQLQHAAPRPVVDLLISLFGAARQDQGDELLDDSTGPVFAFVPTQPSLLMRGDSNVLRQIEAIIQRLDEPAAGQQAAGAPGTTPSDATAGQRGDENLKVCLFPLRNRPGDAVAADLLRLAPSGKLSFKVVDHQPNWIEVTGSNRALLYVEAMIKSLDVADYGAAGSVDGFPITDADSAETDHLRIAYAEHNARVMQEAAEARQALAAGEVHEQQQALQQAVAEAFEVRQQLQRAELGVLESKLAAMRRILDAREQIKEQIIQRRVEELLNPALEWNTSDVPAQQAGEAAASPIGNLPADGQTDPNVPLRTVTSPYSNARVGASERLYQGRTESEWQRLFSAETDYVAKQEAATALLILARALPPEQRADCILDIGEELVDGQLGERALDFAFDTSLGQWIHTQQGQNNQFLQVLMRVVQAIPAPIYADKAASAFDGNSDARAAFAFSSMHNFSQAYQEPEAARLLFERMSHIEKSISRPVSGLALLVEINAAKSATEEELRPLAQELVTFIQSMRERSSQQDALPPQFVEWLGQLQLPVALRGDVTVLRSLAELSLGEVVRSGGTRSILFSPGMFPVAAPQFDQATINRLRSYSGSALDAWVAVANDYLEEHPSAPYSPADRAGALHTSRVLSVYSDADQWPVAQTAELLTLQLRAAYSDDPNAKVDQPVSELLPTTPTVMLSEIVAITGQIPEFVRTESPRSAVVAKQIATLDRLLAGEVSQRRLDEEFESLNGLLGDAPRETVERLLKASKSANGGAAIIEFNDQHGKVLATLLSGRSDLNAASATANSPGGFIPFGASGQPTPSRQPIDPLLLLAIFADLAGTDKDLDARIASLESLDLSGGVGGQGFADHIRNLLASQLQSRQHAARILREMAAKTESPELLDMIRAIDPGAVAADK